MAVTYPMDISQIDEGKHLTVVVTMTVFDPSHESHVVRLHHSGILCRFTGLMEGGYVSYTLCDAVMGKQFPMPMLSSDSTTRVLCHDAPSWVNMRKMVDGCCGLGGIAHGAQAVGISTTVSVDVNSHMTDLHQVHDGSEIVIGDVGDIEVIKQIGQKFDGAKIFSSGFNCQPFSTLGDGLGGRDPRAQSLPKSLQAAYFLQSRVVLLECVLPAKDDGFVVQSIEHFLKVTGFKKESIDLHLQDVWPCRRSRVWWLLFDPMLGDLGLHGWPRLTDVPAVKCLIPYISRWDPRDELALGLDQTESHAFGVEDGSYCRYLLSSEGVSPTALHAWGSQLRACPCGCRPVALSERRLSEKGLFGLLVHSQSDALPSPGLRHVHPNEALALNGMDCTIDFGLQVRLTLSGVGQIASPLQAAWLLSFVVARLEVLQHGKCEFTSESQLFAFRSWLIMKCQLTWPCTDCMIPDVKMKELVSFWHECSDQSITQVVHPTSWEALQDTTLTIASVLDHIIRTCCKPDPRWVLPSPDEPETPWIDEVICDPKCDFALAVGVSTVSLIDIDGASCEFGFVAGSTVADFLEAHGKLNGPFHVASISDGMGFFISPECVIENGQQIQVFLSDGREGSRYPSDAPGGSVIPPLLNPDADAGGRPEDHACIESSGQALPEWECGPLPKLPVGNEQTHLFGDTVPDSHSPSPIGNDGLVRGDLVSQDPKFIGSAAALLALTEQQFLRLTMPCVEDLSKLGTLRSQLLRSEDRLKLLDVQNCLWADDEVSFHLNQVLMQMHQGERMHDVALPILVDPILMSAWLHDCGFPIEQWAHFHRRVLQQRVQVLGVGCLHGHWVPFQIVPCGFHANIFTWDAPQHDHSKLNWVLEAMAKHLGFSTTLVSRQQRLFFESRRCGALAIHFIHSVLHGTMLPISQEEANTVHETLRKKFVDATSASAFVVRPWIWGNGENDDHDESRDEDQNRGECRLLPRMPTGCAALPLTWHPDTPDMPIDSVTFGGSPNAAFPSGWDVISSLLGIAPFLADPREFGPFDIGICPPSCFPFVMTSQVDELLNMDVVQLQSQPIPKVFDPFSLWGIRHQVMCASDRLLMLSKQYGVWSDDEIRFQLQSLRNVLSQHECTSANRYLILDPVVISAWLDPLSGTGESWARFHPEVMDEQCTVISVVCVEHHWVPVLLVPCADSICLVTSDLAQYVAPRLINVLHRVAVALGFKHITFDHDARGFTCRSVCGAVAIIFLHHRLLGAPRVFTYAAAWGAHASYRHQFAQGLTFADRVPRPWIWGSGLDEESEKSEKSWPSDDEGGDPTAASSSGAPASVGRTGPSFHGCIPIDVRLDLIREHGYAMGDDEIRYHLQDLQTQKVHEIAAHPSNTPGVICFESLNFLSWDDVGHILTEKWCNGFPQVKQRGFQIIGVVLEGDHWIPLWIVPAGLVLVVHTFDDVLDYDIFDGKLRWMGLHLGFEDVVIHRIPNGLPTHQMCGAHALAFIGHVLLGIDLPSSLDELNTMRLEMRASFVQAMYEGSICFCPVVWGMGGTGALMKSLSAELVSHGVPLAASEQRASQAIRAIGSESLLQAMQAKNPWRQLKALANNVKFKFVLPDELEASIAANKGKAVGHRSKKDRPLPGVPPNIDLDPAKLSVLDGTFRAGGRPLPQLRADQIGPVSSGFVLMTLSEAEPYLKASQVVSQEPLALVVFCRPDVPLQSMLSQSRLIVPCRCTVDNEPVLADATLIQIGTGIVEKFAGDTLVSLDSPDVRTLRIMVFRDEVADWHEFVKAPVRALVTMFPALRRCHTDGCTCPAWHNEEALSIREPILDLWKRQFMRYGFKPIEAAKADLYCVSIRIPAVLLERILNLSGSAGAYVEPRNADGTQVLQEFMVVWASKMSHRDLLHLKQTNPAVTGLARIGDRRGLRVHADQAQAVHKIVRPDTLFLPQGVRSQFLAGPFPFGLDRQGVCRAMKLAGWQCRPLQPSSPQPGKGVMWLIQAVEEPPSTIVFTNHGEILISKHRPSEQTDRLEHAKPIASAATLALCGGGLSGKDEDPWSKNDPWSQFQPSTGAGLKPPGPSESMQQMETRIHAAVLAKMPQSMDDDVPDRLVALEGQVHQLMCKQNHMDTQFQEFSHQQNQHVSSLQSQLNAQSQNFQGQMETQHQNIQAMFETQLAHIRGLLSKRPRDDNE